MSVYQINKILYLTENDAYFQEEIKSNPTQTLEEFPLSKAELRALITGDVATLFEMGVHAFLLSTLARYELFGVTEENYLPRIRREQ